MPFFKRGKTKFNTSPSIIWVRGALWVETSLPRAHVGVISGLDFLSYASMSMPDICVNMRTSTTSDKAVCKVIPPDSVFNLTAIACAQVNNFCLAGRNDPAFRPKNREMVELLTRNVMIANQSKARLTYGR